MLFYNCRKFLIHCRIILIPGSEGLVRLRFRIKTMLWKCFMVKGFKCKKIFICRVVGVCTKLGVQLNSNVR